MRQFLMLGNMKREWEARNPCRHCLYYRSTREIVRRLTSNSPTLHFFVWRYVLWTLNNKSICLSVTVLLWFNFKSCQLNCLIWFINKQKFFLASANFSFNSMHEVRSLLSYTLMWLSFWSSNILHLLRNIFLNAWMN